MINYSTILRSVNAKLLEITKALSRTFTAQADVPKTIKAGESGIVLKVIDSRRPKIKKAFIKLIIELKNHSPNANIHGKYRFESMSVLPNKI